MRTPDFKLWRHESRMRYHYPFDKNHITYQRHNEELTYRVFPPSVSYHILTGRQVDCLCFKFESWGFGDHSMKEIEWNGPNWTCTKQPPSLAHFGRRSRIFSNPFESLRVFLTAAEQESYYLPEIFTVISILGEWKPCLLSLILRTHVGTGTMPTCAVTRHS